MKQYLTHLVSKDKKLLQELLVNIDDSLHRRGKRLSHVRFARPTLRGWSFFTKKAVLWDIVEEITKKTAKGHTHCQFGSVADVVSHVINLSEKDFGLLRVALL